MTGNITGPRRGAAFFDLDKTVIATPSMVALARPLYDAGLISRWLIARSLWTNLVFTHLGADEARMRRVTEAGLRIIRGWDAAQISTIVRDNIAGRIEPIVYSEARDLIEQHRRAGRLTFLVSAAPEEIVVPVAQALGMDHAIASRAAIDDDGRYTGEAIVWNHGAEKGSALRGAVDRHGLDLGQSYAYSDSHTDVPMLELVGHPVVVNPDRRLAKIARAEGWQRVRFTRTSKGSTIDVHTSRWGETAA